MTEKITEEGDDGGVLSRSPRKNQRESCIFRHSCCWVLRGYFRITICICCVEWIHPRGCRVRRSRALTCPWAAAQHGHFASSGAGCLPVQVVCTPGPACPPSLKMIHWIIFLALRALAPCARKSLSRRIPTSFCRHREPHPTRFEGHLPAQQRTRLNSSHGHHILPASRATFPRGEGLWWLHHQTNSKFRQQHTQNLPRRNGEGGRAQ